MPFRPSLKNLVNILRVYVKHPESSKNAPLVYEISQEQTDAQIGQQCIDGQGVLQS